jgi:hypothetical protein
MSIPDMYSLIRGSDVSWGIDGYEVPKLPFDTQKSILDKKYYAMSVGKQKRPRQHKLDQKEMAKYKRGSMFDALEK